jgi:hypothetical protein
MKCGSATETTQGVDPEKRDPPRSWSSLLEVTMVQRIASCACGRLRVTAEGEPDGVSICCCTECQRRTGSAYGVQAYFDASAIKVIEGSYTEFRRRSDAGRSVTLRFCPTCGSTVYWELQAAPGKIGVAAGAFTDPTLPEPGVISWAGQRTLCVPLPDDVPTYVQSRPLGPER